MVATLLRSGFLAALGIVAGLVFNGIRPDGVSLGAAPPPAVCQVPSVARPVEHDLRERLADHTRRTTASLRLGPDIGPGHNELVGDPDFVCLDRDVALRLVFQR